MVLDDETKQNLLSLRRAWKEEDQKEGRQNLAFGLTVVIVVHFILIFLAVLLAWWVWSIPVGAELEENLWDFSYYPTENIKLAYKHEYFLGEHIHYSVAVPPYIPKHSRFRWWHPEKREWYYFVARDCIGKDGRQFWHDRYDGDKLLGRSRIDFPKRTWVGVLDGRPARGLIKEQSIEWLEWGDTYYYKDVPLAEQPPIAEEVDNGD